jgi:hypothetical protein
MNIIKATLNLLKIAIENPAVAERAIIITTPGPAYIGIIKRIQDQAKIEHADRRAVKVFHALSKYPSYLRTPIVFSFRPFAERVVFAYSRD